MREKERERERESERERERQRERERDHAVAILAQGAYGVFSIDRDPEVSSGGGAHLCRAPPYDVNLESR